MADIVDFASIVIAVVAVIISLIVLYYSRKREEFHIAFELIINLERLFNEILKTEILSKERKGNHEAPNKVTKKNITKWSPEWAKIHQFSDHLSFISLLIKNKEITNKSILNHFAESIQGELTILRNYEGEQSLGLITRLELLQDVWPKAWYKMGLMENLKIRFRKIFQGKSK